MSSELSCTVRAHPSPVVMNRTNMPATLLQLQNKLNTLIEWVQDPKISPEQRFQLLQEIAEEAARYKLGADDKVRVAGGASEGVSSGHIVELIVDDESPTTYHRTTGFVHHPQFRSPITLYPGPHSIAITLTCHFASRPIIPRSQLAIRRTGLCGCCRSI